MQLQGRALYQLPLYRIGASGDLRQIAQLVSLDQEIAADGAFSCMFVADLASLNDQPWVYRHAHWEAGMIGHMLYLLAELTPVSAGSAPQNFFRGTGIGAFFSDVVRNLLFSGDAVSGQRWRTVYHFAVGRAAKEDEKRIADVAPYAHLAEMRRRGAGDRLEVMGGF